MAVCKYCKLEMNTADSCVKMRVKTIDGELDPVLYGAEAVTKDHPPAPGHRCHDCGVLPGHYHHPGCDWEECPRCHEQLITCDCEPVEEDELDKTEA
jgi:hypothetical protein